MKIHKILNNNVVVIVDSHQKEQIVMGRGIAFKKHAGDEFDDSLIDKTFILDSKENSSKFQEMIVDIPIDHVMVCEQIIADAKKTLNKDLNEMIYISLTDHIHTAIMRFLEGIQVKNALLYDIRRFYPDEYKVGIEALKKIEEEFKVQLPEDEAGFIALHLVNAEMDDSRVQDMYSITKIMQEICNIVKYTYKTQFDEDSVYFYRFMTHLKFFAQRMVRHTPYNESSEDELLELIVNKYPQAYKGTCKIEEFIQKKYQYPLSDDEKLYLTIHIERLIYKSNKQNKGE